MTAEERLAEARRRWHEFCQFLDDQKIDSTTSIMDGSDLEESLVHFACQEEIRRETVDVFKASTFKVGQPGQPERTYRFSKPMVIVHYKWVYDQFPKEEGPIAIRYICRFEDNNVCDGHVSGYGNTPEEAYAEFLQDVVCGYNHWTTPGYSKADDAVAKAFRGLLKMEGDPSGR